MSAPTKRRHASYYLSLLLATVVVFSVVMQLAAWQRAAIIADLADRVAHRDGAEASAALRQLAAMPRPPVEVLVVAATSSDRAVASEAQYLIGDLLRRWQRRIELNRRVGAVSRQLTQLADALVEHHTSSYVDPRWVRSTSDDILRLANILPAKYSPLVAAQCDALLAAADMRERTRTAFIGRRAAAAAQPVMPAGGVSTADDDRRFVGGISDADDDRKRAGSVSTADDGSAAKDNSATESLPTVSRITSPPTGSGLESATESPLTINDSKSATESPPTLAPSELSKDSPRTIGATQSRRPLKWLHPMMGVVPAMPISISPTDGESETHAPPTEPLSVPVDDRSAARPLARTPSRELLARWLEADGREVFPLEEELTRRGFGRLSARLVEPLFSDDTEERLRLVDDVLIEPGVDARPWLMLLAEDADADVRLLAVTIMATSADSTLIEKAWQVAIRDRDPRIAGLADRLRERRDSVPPR